MPKKAKKQTLVDVMISNKTYNDLKEAGWLTKKDALNAKGLRELMKYVTKLEKEINNGEDPVILGL
jgi:hypothetical protein